MTLFRLDASIRVEGSASREIADIVESEWLSEYPGLPCSVGTSALTSCRRTPGRARSAPRGCGSRSHPEQQSAVGFGCPLVDELLAADAILLAVPLYNFGVSQHFKTWVDLVVTDPRAAAGGPLCWRARKWCCAPCGAGFGAGTPREGWDHSTGYLRRILGDVFGAELTWWSGNSPLSGSIPRSTLSQSGRSVSQGALASAREAGKVVCA